MDSITADRFANLIAKTLEDYEEGVEEKVEKAINEVAKDTLDDLKSNSIIPERTGKYKKSFYLKDVYKSRGKQKGIYKVVVANKKYRVGHLLEHGHLTRNGSRTRAYPHWAKAQKVADTLPDKIKEVLV